MEKDTIAFLKHMQEQLEKYGHVLQELSRTLDEEVPDGEKLKKATGTAEVISAPDKEGSEG